MTLNRDWHLKHKMPVNAGIEDRIEWHLEHQKHCLCKPFPKKLAEKMKNKERKKK